MKITFLGTGTSQGVPVIGCRCEVCQSLDFRNKRLRTSIRVEISGQSFVVDTGPDFRQQMLRENVQRLDAVIFTHAHRDHTAGLDDVRAYNFMQNSDMPVYGRQEVLDQLKMEFAYAFAKDAYPGLPRITLNQIDERPFELNGVPITPLPVLHLRLPVLGFRFGNFSYITDANIIPEETLDRLKGTEVLVLNALQIESHVSHFNLSEALAMIDRIKPAKAYLTHISHKLGLHGAVEKKLPENVSLAYDGLQVELQ
ncbi:phosphoribosyl 1,2-cyclic phosphate phosphodiesterase [Chryseolinea serpens]|uniref:Phosphoribosyl 1,2-cyclic phosphate phosphodiesterase n=1 Tax=Chryseolinea serpens TaxID=947013 RepID=A0A1M5MDS8_9BACT|nr:MBL fold metallo-hydrolase [Chryseolinea serpens]SHG75544.1 phosphoribosyl 1,2-cyclic phosphate phosphodiesterase [Chryseolinea serpens]